MSAANGESGANAPAGHKLCAVNAQPDGLIAYNSGHLLCDGLVRLLPQTVRKVVTPCYLSAPIGNEYGC